MKHRLLIALALCALPMVMLADEYSEEVVPASGNTIEAVHRGGGVFDLTAVPASGWTFVEWSDTHSTTATRTETVTSSSVVYDAKFEDHRCTLYGPKYPAPVGGGGTVSAAAGSCECDWILTATPASGWAFKEWTDGNTSNPRTVSVDPDEDEVSYTATFVPACVVNEPVIASVTGLGTSSVTVLCEGDCSWTLAVTAASGYTFMGWADDASAPATRTVSSTASGVDTYTPVFERTCVVNKPVVPSSPYYTATVVEGATPCTWTITLSLTPASGYTFLGWDEDGDGDPDGNTSLVLSDIPSGDDPAATLTPVFEQTCVVNKPLIAAATGMSTSSVTATGNDCEWRLTVTALENWEFTQWSDGNTSNPRVVTSGNNPAVTYTPVFEDRSCALYEDKYDNPDYGGSVAAVQDALDECKWTLTATPEEHYRFTGWSDAVITNPRVVTINPALDENVYTANFERIPCEYKDSYTSTGGGGTVAAVRTDECTCAWQLTATPTTGWTFQQWNDGNTDNPRTIYAEDDEITYTATFEDHTCALYPPVIPSPIVGGSMTVTQPSGYCECTWKLTFTPDPGYTFLGWDDDGDGTPDGNTDLERDITSDDSGPVTYTPIVEDHRCSVYPPLIASVVGVTASSITPTGSECEWTISVTTNTAECYRFVHWNDLDSSDPDYAANPRTVTSTNGQGSSITYTPVVEQTTCLYEPAYTPSEGGTVAAVMTNECDCEWQLTATPTTGWTFTRWSDDNTDNPRTVNMSASTETFSAIFEDHRCTTYEAKVVNPVTGGTVTAVNGACECDWTLTATPTEGYAFLQWEDCNYLNPRTVTVDPDAGPQTYTAHFIASDAYIDSWTATDIVVATKTQDLTPTTATIYINGVAIDAAHTDQVPDPITGEHGMWTVPGGLNDHAGEQISIIFYDNTTGLPVSVVTGTVPYISTGDKSFNTILPPLPENTDVEVVSGTLTFDDDDPMVLGALTVYADAKAVIPTGKDVTFTHIYMLGDGINHTYPQLVANGSIHNLNNDTIYYDYTLNYASFYPLAVPYDVKCEHIRTKTGKQASYEVQWYNGEDRAANAHAWTVFDDQAVGATLRAGTGYIVFAVPYKWNGTRHATVDVRFPMVAPLTTPETEKSTPVSLYGGEGTSASNKNWNLVGNPYLANYTTSDDARLLVGTYEPGISTSDNEKYEYNNDGVRYITMTTDGYQTYQQQRADEGVTIKAFTNFFIQSASTGDLVFTLSQRAQNAPRRKVSRAESEELRELAFGIVLKAADQSDRTGLLYGEDFTEAYEMNADLVKMSGSTPVLELYSLAGDEKRAFNALHMTAIRTLVPLGYTNAPMGQMTIAFDYDHYDASSLEAVMLTDYETGRIVNLLDEDYSFTTTGTEENARFVINAVLAPRVTTDIGGTGVDGSSTNELDGVYDLLGRRVSLDMLQQGVYIIIENGQSRKEVIQ